MRRRVEDRMQFLVESGPTWGPVDVDYFCPAEHYVLCVTRDAEIFEDCMAVAKAIHQFVRVNMDEGDYATFRATGTNSMERRVTASLGYMRLSPYGAYFFLVDRVRVSPDDDDPEDGLAQEYVLRFRSTSCPGVQHVETRTAWALAKLLLHRKNLTLSCST